MEKVMYFWQGLRDLERLNCHIATVAGLLCACLIGHWIKHVRYWRVILVFDALALCFAALVLIGAVLELPFSSLGDGIFTPFAIAVYVLVLDAAIRRSKKSVRP